ncbi:MAG: acetyl-CoA hydrolase/transferase family protein [Lachnospiraceae bacterium]|nr:acetyl-CoA hydrolase/transferase family protein [Lachnospiraceae bacterium]
MSDWKQYYKDHLTTAEEAVKHIKSGDRLVIAHACGEPSYLVDAMMANAASYRDVEIVHMVAMGKCEYCKPEYAENFRHNAYFVGGTSRKAIEEGRGDFTPCFFFEIPRTFTTTMPVDVAMVMCTPPDENGKCSLGVSVDYTQPAVKAAKTVIAQINPQMPWTGPYSTIDVEDIDFIVEKDAPLIELAPPHIGEVEQKIGEYCASLINDGDTLQLGIGAIPDAVLRFLGDKKDLGIHSEMFSDGVVELAEKGVFTNARKTLNPGKFVVGFLMGTRKLYDFVDHNPAVDMRSIDYVNDPFIIAQNDNLISINSAVQVDLYGQAASEMIGPKQISGVGGQVDFVRGASASKGGKSILAFPSTVKGKVSKIVPYLDPGAAVTTSRNDIDYVVTEYGIAALKGHTLRDRARALISIAHPDFRDELKDEFEKRFHCKY